MEPDALAITTGLLGGLAVFLIGMEGMTDALKALAGEGMKTVLARLTTNRVTAALTGVIVNDSIVLVDFINRKLRSGAKLEEALLSAGRRRFRPIMHTSMTTIAGLPPIN